MPEPVSLRDVDLDLLTTLIEDEAHITARFGLQLEPGYLAFPGALEVTRTLMNQGKMLPPWGTCLFLVGRQVVGIGGYKGPPGADDSVEIGYSIAPQCRGRGFATAATNLLVERAAAAAVRIVRAHTLAEANASTRVLMRCGFTQDGVLIDPEDGALWCWQRRLD
jgi:[ribosomal protein S5]-alanine N-acetyltransferase